jgi:hypothetical protein
VSERSAVAAMIDASFADTFGGPSTLDRETLNISMVRVVICGLRGRKYKSSAEVADALEQAIGKEPAKKSKRLERTA